jgi:hypothetical protein
VDLVDLSNLAANYGMSPRGWGDGDFDCDHDVDLVDLSTLAGNYGSGTAQAHADFAMLVPEPAGVFLGACGFVAMITSRHRRRRRRRRRHHHRWRCLD